MPVSVKSATGLAPNWPHPGAVEQVPGNNPMKCDLEVTKRALVADKLQLGLDILCTKSWGLTCLQTRQFVGDWERRIPKLTDVI